MVDDEAMSCRADAMTKQTDADLCKELLKEDDPAMALRYVDTLLDCIEDELANDTDYSAAVGHVIEARKQIEEAINTLEHLYDDDDARKPSERRVGGRDEGKSPEGIEMTSQRRGSDGSDGRRADDYKILLNRVRSALRDLEMVEYYLEKLSDGEGDAP